MNMNMTSSDRRIYCRIVLGIISITWHPLLFLPLSFTDSISLSSHFIPPSPPWQKMQRGLSSHPAGDFPPWGFCDLAPFSFNFKFQCPPLASQLNNIGRASKASLSLSFYPSLLLCPSPSSLNIFHSQLLKISISLSMSLTDIRAGHLSLSHTLSDHSTPPGFELQLKFLHFFISHLYFFLSLDTEIIFLLGLFRTPSVSFSFSVFNLSVHPSQWIRFAARQQVRSVYASSGLTSPPRQAEGDLHCLDPSNSSSTRFVFYYLFTIHSLDAKSSWLHPLNSAPPERATSPCNAPPPITGARG